LRGLGQLFIGCQKKGSVGEQNNWQDARMACLALLHIKIRHFVEFCHVCFIAMKPVWHKDPGGKRGIFTPNLSALLCFLRCFFAIATRRTQEHMRMAINLHMVPHVCYFGCFFEEKFIRIFSRRITFLIAPYKIVNIKMLLLKLANWPKQQKAPWPGVTRLYEGVFGQNANDTLVAFLI